MVIELDSNTFLHSDPEYWNEITAWIPSYTAHREQDTVISLWRERKEEWDLR